MAVVRCKFLAWGTEEKHLVLWKLTSEELGKNVPFYARRCVNAAQDVAKELSICQPMRLLSPVLDNNADLVFQESAIETLTPVFLTGTRTDSDLLLNQLSHNSKLVTCGQSTTSSI